MFVNTRSLQFLDDDALTQRMEFYEKMKHGDIARMSAKYLIVAALPTIALAATGFVGMFVGAAIFAAGIGISRGVKSLAITEMAGIEAEAHRRLQEPRPLDGPETMMQVPALCKQFRLGTGQPIAVRTLKLKSAAAAAVPANAPKLH